MIVLRQPQFEHKCAQDTGPYPIICTLSSLAGLEEHTYARCHLVPVEYDYKGKFLFAWKLPLYLPTSVRFSSCCVHLYFHLLVG